MLVLRAVKVAMVASIALFASLVAFGNITDYDTNFEFVRHVLMMDTTLPQSGVRYRAISSPAMHHAAYIAIILTEGTIAVLCGIGALAMFRAFKKSSRAFNSSKQLSYAGLGLGLLLWQTGFIIIGGEWFSMWQSPTWNGVPAAFRFAVMMGMTLIIVALPDGDIETPPTTS